MKKIIYQFILKLFGWKVTGDYPAHIKQKILVAAPHTSNWDFPLGLLVRGVIEDDVKYVGKASLFKGPLGYIMRFLGGVPVNRSRSNNFVDAVVDMFTERKSFSILFAAEGTRKKVDKLKTGFYHIAKQANVPIIPSILDYEKKEFRFLPLINTTSDTEEDLIKIEKIFRGIKGYYPEKSF